MCVWMEQVILYWTLLFVGNTDMVPFRGEGNNVKQLATVSLNTCRTTDQFVTELISK